MGRLMDSNKPQDEPSEGIPSQPTMVDQADAKDYPVELLGELYQSDLTKWLDELEAADLDRYL